ncbi:MAG TPA: hypothetical protein PK705_09640 [Clostridia bacterium]|nr:hypothetical protein [Clostridia bacterium]
MNNEQLIKDVIRWIITSKNTEMLDASDVDLVYKDYITEQVGNVPPANACPQLCDVSDVEMKCPECGADMKEWVLNYQCRNLDCRFKVNKKFS